MWSVRDMWARLPQEGKEREEAGLAQRALGPWLEVLDVSQGSGVASSVLSWHHFHSLPDDLQGPSVQLCTQHPGSIRS